MTNSTLDRITVKNLESLRLHLQNRITAIDLLLREFSGDVLPSPPPIEPKAIDADFEEIPDCSQVQHAFFWKPEKPKNNGPFLKFSDRRLQQPLKAQRFAIVIEKTLEAIAEDNNKFNDIYSSVKEKLHLPSKALSKSSIHSALKRLKEAKKIYKTNRTTWKATPVV